MNALNKNRRISDAVENSETNIVFLATYPDNVLSDKLELIHIQMEIAEQKRNTESLELLEIWRSQVIDARIYKAENNIPDAPNEIELAIADIETTVAKGEEREESFTQEALSKRSSRPKVKEEDNDQMSLF